MADESDTSAPGADSDQAGVDSATPGGRVDRSDGAGPAGQTLSLEEMTGRPYSHDELDPELIALPRPRTNIGPVLALSIVQFCVYMGFVLHSDLRFSHNSETPRALDSMAEAIDPGNAEQFVTVRAIPDRTFAVRVARSKADQGNRLAPVQGSNGKLWLMIGGNVWTAGIRYEEVYSGRLRRVADLPFADELRRHVAERGPEPRFVRPDQVARAVEQNTTTLIDPAGDHITVAADTPVHIYEEVADRVRIHVFATDTLPTSQAWTDALVGAGMVPPEARPIGQKDSWIYLATVPGGVAAARAALQEKQLFSALLDPVKKVHEATFGELTRDRDVLSAGGIQLPLANISWIAVAVARELDPDAMVLLGHEKPELYWYVLPLYAGLGFFGLLFLWALWRTVRAALKPDDPLPSALSSPELPGRSTGRN